MCDDEIETMEHLIFLCNWAWSIWADSLLKLVINRSTFTKIEVWMDYHLNSLANKWVRSIKASTLFCYLRWYIWKACNEFFFEGIRPSSTSVITRAIFLCLKLQFVSTSNSKSLFDVPQSYFRLTLLGGSLSIFF